MSWWFVFLLFFFFLFFGEVGFFFLFVRAVILLPSYGKKIYVYEIISIIREIDGDAET